MEVNIIHWLQSLTNPIFTGISEFLATIGDNGIIYIIIALIMMLGLKYRKAGIFLFLNLASCGVVGIILKKVIGRERPCFAHPDQVLPCRGDESQFTSCPSGHMIMATAFVLVMCKYFPKYKWLWITYLIIMGISRMYLGAHYLSDLLLAIAIAVVIFVIISVIWKKYFKNRRLENKSE